MPRKRVGVFLVIALACVTWLAGQAPPPNAACLSCHGMAGSAPEKLKLSEKSFADSVHGRLGCTDCHAFQPVRAPGGVPHPRTLPPPDCTANCHRQTTPEKP